jgi:hypothetical protein
MIKKYLLALALTLATFWGNAQINQSQKLSANKKHKNISSKLSILSLKIKAMK